MLADEEDARLGQIVVRVVRDAHADDVPALERVPEGDEAHELRMGGRERLEVGGHLRVVVVVLEPRREVVGNCEAAVRGQGLRSDAEAAEQEPTRLLVGPVELDVIGPVRLADVVALGHEHRALLAGVHAVDDEALDRGAWLAARRSRQGGGRKRQRKRREPPDRTLPSSTPAREIKCSRGI